MAKKKAEDKVFPDEIFLNAAIKDGRAVRKELSMKAIGEPDVRLQQRVKTDPNHVRLLEGILRDGDQLRPIIVFEDAAGKFHVADGFHRHGAHAKFGAASIWAWVIPGEWRDAMVYSTMCNRNLCLKRTPEDIKKAVFTLLDDEEWRGNSDLMIANHCGISSSTSSKYRVEHSKAKGTPIPKTVKSSDGRTRKYRNLEDGRPSVSSSHDGEFFVNFGGKAHRYRSQNEALAATDTSVAAKAERRRSLGLDNLRSFFCRENLLFNNAALGVHFGINSLKGHGVVLVSGTFDRLRFKGASDSISAAVGDVLLGRQLIDPTARAVVVCYVEDATPELIEAGRALGVEFLNPEELVASIKTEGEADRESA